MRGSTDPALPRNESDLLLRRPTTHLDGVFPRRLLYPGERVLFETRPRRNERKGWAYYASAVLFVLSALFVLVGALVAVSPPEPGVGDASGILALGLVGVAIWGSALVALWAAHRRTAFALTHLRVLAVEGFGQSRFRFARWEQISGLSATSELVGDITFRVEGGSGAPGAGSSGHGTILWTGLERLPTTYAFAQLAFATEAERVRRESRDLRRNQRFLEGRVRCEYCGNFVAVPETGDPPSTCPRCTAPLPTPGPTGAPTRSRAAPSGLWFRPLVDLGRSAVGWFRPLPVLWALVLVLLVALLESGFDSTGGASSAATLPLVGGLLLAGPVAFLVWGQTIRKWGSVLRTARASPGRDAEAEVHLLRPLTRKLWMAWAAYGAAIVLIPGTLLSGEAFVASSPTGASNPLFGIGLVGAAAALTFALTAGFGVLLESFAALVDGSGDSAIDRALQWGRVFTRLGLGFAFWPVGWVTVLGVTGTTVVGFGWIALVGLLGPGLVYLGTAELVGAFDRWNGLADRAWEGASFDPGWGSRTVVSGAATATTGPLLGGEPAHLARWFAVVAVVVVTLGILAGTGELASGLAAFAPHPGTGAVTTILANAGAQWTLPPNHYQALTTWVATPESLTGSFASSSPVRAWVFDSNSYNIWLIGGNAVGYQQATGNVTAAGLHATLSHGGWWYVVVANYSPAQPATVTWTSACEVARG